jgi:hypothetical protein
MALMITTSINCDVREPECPNDAISQGSEIYVIDPEEAHRCAAFRTRCSVEVPVDCIPVNPDCVEMKDGRSSSTRR